MFTPDTEKRRYVSILADGKFHQSVPEGTENAIKRTYETSDGTKGTKHEFVFSKISATIKSVSFEEGKYGEQILVTVEGDEGEATIVTGSGNSFALDIMNKLPRVDFSQPVEFSPFSFESETGKVKKGMTLVQDGKKLVPYFSGKNVQGNWESLHGFPEVKDRDNLNSKKWQLYFLTVSEFLTDYTKNHICPQLNNPSETRSTTEHNVTAEENGAPDADDIANSIPF